ncbi:MAG: response regulator [Gammaproteobacteria bacterium]|nr:response regulator [Gammaproteobacteria bacterium]
MEAIKDNVCVVDEHNNTRSGICNLLGAYGLSAHAHASANELLEEDFTHSRTGVIVLDLEMSQKNGAEVIKNLRDKGCDIPVVLMTNEPKCPQAQWSSKHGAVILKKPLNGIDLLRSIDSILGLL